MTHEEAEKEAHRRNVELGEQGDDVAFYIAVERAAGDWAVERREERKSWTRRIFDAFMSSPGP